MFQSVQKFFHDGGNLMLLNVGVAVVALAITAERLFMLLFRLRINDRAFLDAVEKLVNAGNFDRAIKLCLSVPGAALPKVTRAALTNVRLGTHAVTDAIEESMLEVLPQVTKRAGILWPIANVATLLGLIGTVFGLIQAFAAVGIASPDQKSALLTAGIAHAMNNTALGLAIALSCIIGHMILSLITKGITDGLEHGSLRIQNVITRRQLSAGRDQPAGSTEG